jgi:hypothetical protein
MPRPPRKARHRRADPEKPWEFGWEFPTPANAPPSRISEERLAELRQLYGTRGKLTLRLEVEAREREETERRSRTEGAPARARASLAL